jgi:hypothetical protein
MLFAGVADSISDSESTLLDSTVPLVRIDATSALYGCSTLGATLNCGGDREAMIAER